MNAITTRHTPFLRAPRRALAAMLTALALTLGTASSPAVAQSEIDTDEIAALDSYLGLVQSFYGIIGSMHEISEDPELSTIYFMHQIQETYEESGNKARAADVLRDVVDNGTSPTVRIAAAIMLGDLLKETGRTDEAIEAFRAGLKSSLQRASNSN